jgi:hypothetical protein
VNFGRGGAICSGAARGLSGQAATNDRCVSFGKGGRYCLPATDPGKEVQQ